MSEETPRAHDPLEEALGESLRELPAGELPARVRNALVARRAQRRQRQLTGASALVVVLGVGAGVWSVLTGAPGVSNRAAPGGGLTLIEARAICEPTLVGLVRCNGGYDALLESGGEIALGDEWDLGWVSTTPPLEPGEM